MAELVVNGIKKAFGETAVLHGVDIEVPDGEFAVLVGPSGCGKSTLLRLIAGLESSDDGKILFAGKDVTDTSPRERDIAMVFQSYALYPHLTVRRNLAFGLELRRTDKAEIARRIDEVAEMLGLGPLLDRMPKQLSGGQRQRVAMGRAIVRRPALFLFDEPLSNLDAALRGQVRVEIKRLHARLGATIVYVTHDQVEAMTLADRLFVLNGGHVEQSGTPMEVYEHPRTKFVASFLGMPGMNFLDATVSEEDGQWWAAGQGFRLALSPKLLGAAPEPGAATIGVRPHDVALGDGDGAFQLHVDVAETLGTESFAHGSAGGAPFVARLDGDVRPAPGETLDLEVPAAKVHVFDKESGRAWSADR